MLQSRESGRLYYLVTGPNGEYITGEPDLPPPPDPFSERVNYYDETYQGRPVRIVTLRLPLDTGKTESMVLVQVAENRSARNEFARQILLPHGPAAGAADRVRGRSCCGTRSGAASRRSTRCAARSKAARTATSPRSRSSRRRRKCGRSSTR